MAYVREEKITCFDIPNRGFRIQGEVKDDLHHFKVELGIDFFTDEIFEAKAEALNTPFPICVEAIDVISNLVGLRIGDGISRKINQALIGPEGCFHLAELIINCISAGLQATAREIPDWIPKEEYARAWKSREKTYLGRCIHYAQPNATSTMEIVHSEILPNRKQEEK
ncbi:MAG: DUF2889 domain-containing protein [Syntrophomonadaceae bacterium]|nr:DUF2889 domain-containing protein [Syntrophomonadaceae bacterium]